MVGISDGNPCTFSSSKNRFMYNTTQKKSLQETNKENNTKKPLNNSKCLLRL
jgi:hypothetical protein